MAKTFLSSSPFISRDKLFLFLGLFKGQKDEKISRKIGGLKLLKKGFGSIVIYKVHNFSAQLSPDHFGS